MCRHYPLLAVWENCFIEMAEAEVLGRKMYSHEWMTRLGVVTEVPKMIKRVGEGAKLARNLSLSLSALILNVHTSQKGQPGNHAHDIQT
jgi:hypothetical protein